MGVFDDYGRVQLKVGQPRCHYFQLGDAVEIPDGVYLGNEGVVVIHGGKFIAQYPEIISKWGDLLQPSDLLYPHNPVIRESAKHLNQWKKTNEKRLRKTTRRT